VQPEPLAVLGELHHPHDVVRKEPLRHLGHAIDHLAQIEDVGQRLHEPVERLRGG